MCLPLAFIGGLGWPEMVFAGFVAVLLFGKRLPEVARSLGKGVTEFKKGIRGVEDDIEETRHPELPRSTDKEAPRAPKFEPPTSPPTEESATGDQPGTSDSDSDPDSDSNRAHTD